MYYSNGNYEALVHARKPAGVDHKKAYIVGGGLAGLAAAVFLVRDAQMPGEQIHILEELPVAGGSLDGANKPDIGFVTRGGREMENHFECMWDMYSSIPSLEVPGASYLDEYYWLDKDDPNSSNCRLIYNRGNEVPDDGKYTLGKTSKEIIKLIMTPEEQLGTETIEEYFSAEFFKTNFWYYWSTMFAFEKWHSAVEMRRYCMRFIHHIDGLPDFTALKFNKYNQYDSMTLPIVKYLEDHGVDFQFNTVVNNVIVETANSEKHAKKLQMTVDDSPQEITLTDDDIVFITNGSITESSTYGDHHTPAKITDEPGPSWELWENLAEQSSEFGHPKVFYQDLPEKAWHISATATIKNTAIDPYIERLTKRDLHDGKVNTGGIITIKDSNWMMSFCIHRQPHFKDQKENETIVWIYALYSNTPGDYIQKNVVDCTGEEITEEWLYHLGVPETLINKLSKQDSINTNPVYTPFVTSYFMPRVKGDRPNVVPTGSKNLAFIGNFAESPTRDTVFTTEYSIRTAMESVYNLLNVDRGVPEVFNSIYDIRELLKSMYYLNDKQKLTDSDLPIPEFVKNKGLQKVKGTWIGKLLEDAKLI